MNIALENISFIKSDNFKSFEQCMFFVHQSKIKKASNFINEVAKLHSLNILKTKFFLIHSSSFLLTLLKFEVTLNDL